MRLPQSSLILYLIFAQDFAYASSFFYCTTFIFPYYRLFFFATILWEWYNGGISKHKRARDGERYAYEGSQMEQNTETKTETKLKPEEMPEYQDKLSQSLIRGWRKQFPEWTDERIIEELEAL